jgi:putative spermidine/putrescine transport system ATP-binding protein
MSTLELEGIAKRFPGAEAAAVNDVSLEAERGELVSLLGPSGCGKSTTLRIVAGFETPDRGRVLLEGADVTMTAPSRRGVGMVFQSYALFPNLSVAENVAFGLRVRRRAGVEITRRVRELLELVHLADLAERAPGQLSGGQQQRVALARALAVEPTVLLLDEPLAALDAVIRTELRAEIRRIQQRLGTTTLYVTHDQEEALSLSDRIVVLRSGRIEQMGTPEEIYRRPRSAFVAGFVGKLNVMPGVVEDAATGLVRVAGGAVRLGRTLARPVGSSVTLATRPECLALTSSGAGEPNRLAAEVEQVEYLGAIAMVHLRQGTARLLLETLNAPGAALPRPGEAVTVLVPEEACVLLPEPAATASGC